MLTSTLGGWRGVFGLVLIALALGLAYASLTSTVLSRWVPQAGTLQGLVLIGLAAGMLILIWLLRSMLR